MKYVLLFCGSAAAAAAFAAMTPDEVRARYEQVGAWFAEHRSKIGGSNQLQGPESATSIRFGPDGPPVVIDGPYLEGKESIGGYAEIEVADLDETLGDGKDMARTRDGGDPPGHDHALTVTREALAAVFREEAGRLAASVTRILGDFDAAEEVVQDALLAAWQQWQADGLPDRRGAWLWTVARRRAIDLLRREARYRERAPAVSFPARQADEDERLMLIFTCCHPALARDLDHYHLYHATRAEFLRELGRPAQARQADERALGLTGNPAERALLEQRLA